MSNQHEGIGIGPSVAVLAYQHTPGAPTYIQRLRSQVFREFLSAMRKIWRKLVEHYYGFPDYRWRNYERAFVTGVAPVLFDISFQSGEHLFELLLLLVACGSQQIDRHAEPAWKRACFHRADKIREIG